jgi:hypothetical protein
MNYAGELEGAGGPPRIGLNALGRQTRPMALFDGLKNIIPRKDAGRFTIFWQQKMCKTPLFFLAKYGKMGV